MDLKFTDEELAFRDEVRAFIGDKLPDDLRRRTRERMHLDKADVVFWQQTLYDRGWAVPGWPVEWGGTDWSPVKRFLFMDEMHQAPAPEVLSFNVNMIGPVIIGVGTEEQKRRFLPSTANLDIWWCQGFSEPGAGSDLAGLRTRAHREGDHYVVNGQKVWTSMAQWADWMFCLVRTDPTVKKQQGITFLLIDMKTPGITVRPVVTLNGHHYLNEVFFDDVRVPVENRIGEENKGWTYGKYLLGNERAGIARVGISKERILRVKELSKEMMVDGRPLSEDPGFREMVAAVEIQLKALEITQLRLLAGPAARDEGGTPIPSILKIRGSELQQETQKLLMHVGGPHALPHLEAVADGPATVAEPDWATGAAASYFFGRAASIYGGSNEIQKNIIAKALLGM